MRKYFIPFIFALGLFAQNFVQAQEIDKQKLDAYFKDTFAKYSQIGASIGVVSEGKLAATFNYGFASSKNKQAISETTVFQVASVSKAFTAAGVGILVDRGLLNWDDFVIDHLPSFRLYDSYATSHFQVKDLLCHHNGYNTFDGDLLWYETSLSAQEVVASFSKLAPKHEIRDEYGYSNIMLVAAALLIEEVSGKSWEDFVELEIFTPLGMINSTTHYEAFLSKSNKAVPHIEKQEDVFRNYLNAKGAVGVKTCVQDLTKWITMWLNNGTVNGKTLLKEETVRFITKAHTPTPTTSRDDITGTYFKAAGLGWFVKDYKGHKLVSHSGGLPGLILNVEFIPDLNAGVIVLTNDETLYPFAVTNYIRDYLIGEEPQDYAALYLKYADPVAKKTRIEIPKKVNSLLPNADILGSYADTYYGGATISLKGNKLHLKLDPSSTFVSDMEPYGPLSYRIRFKDKFLPDGLVYIQLNAQGKAESFKIDLPNPDFHFTNLHFTKK